MYTYTESKLSDTNSGKSFDRNNFSQALYFLMMDCVAYSRNELELVMKSMLCAIFVVSLLVACERNSNTSEDPEPEIEADIRNVERFEVVNENDEFIGIQLGVTNGIPIEPNAGKQAEACKKAIAKTVPRWYQSISAFRVCMGAFCERLACEHYGECGESGLSNLEILENNSCPNPARNKACRTVYEGCSGG